MKEQKKTRYEIIRTIHPTEVGDMTEYGIVAFDENNCEIYRIEAITTDKAAVSELVKICNKGKLSSIHIREVVEDFVVMRS